MQPRLGQGKDSWAELLRGSLRCARTVRMQSPSVMCPFFAVWCEQVLLTVSVVPLHIGLFVLWADRCLLGGQPARSIRCYESRQRYLLTLRRKASLATCCGYSWGSKRNLRVLQRHVVDWLGRVAIFPARSFAFFLWVNGRWRYPWASHRCINDTQAEGFAIGLRGPAFGV